MSKFDPYEHLKVLKNEDGTLTRLVQFPQIPATGDADPVPGQTVVSKDVTLDATKKTWLRIHRPAKIPSNDNKIARLPLVIYFHAGGWILFSVSDALNHEAMNKLSDEIPAIIVAVNFRLAPETRLPGQYDDAMDAINWIKKQATDPNGDPWIKQYADFSRVFMYGTSCGANIVLNTALRVIDHDISPVTIAGIILCQPFIGGKKRTKSELKLAADVFFPLPVIDVLWELALPKGTDRDHRFCNPLGDEQVKEKMKKLGRCLVIGFGGDPLIDRQQDLVQLLVMQGVMVEARFDDVGFHGIEMIDPRRASAIRNFVKEFIV
ncbi:probable carboxylesterase 9 [Cynara cardunculus var. scolymus]|uniref:probable carboxylesterase 9 n=1 Tax=Cynara cardunculus var. scolymus TaxID=59895 RepID=UPI000D629F4B|nr:probable carboxylesterase 9 [Cynara cardunculus var. scolymus]